MSGRINVGQRVTLTSNPANFRVGEHGVVKGILPTGGVEVVFDKSDGVPSRVDVEYLRHSFAEGDVVEVFGNGHIYNGIKGRVKYEHSKEKGKWWVQLERRESTPVLFYYKDLIFRNDPLPLRSAGFYEGERVRANLTRGHELNGEYGMVVSTSTPTLAVRLDKDKDESPGVCRYFEPSELVKTYKEGDKVRVVDPDSTFHKLVGEIVERMPGAREMWKVKFTASVPSPYPVVVDSFMFWNLKYEGPGEGPMKGIATLLGLLNKAAGNEDGFKAVGQALVQPIIDRREKDKKAAMLGRAFGMSEKRIAEHARKSTVSATFVLASGREVRMPDPSEKDWELDDTTPFAFGVGVMISAGFVHVAGYMMKDSDTGEMIGKVIHAEGLCWIKDMERIVNERKKVSVFEERFTCIKELRYYKERIIDAEFEYNGALPTLREFLW